MTDSSTVLAIITADRVSNLIVADPVWASETGLHCVPVPASVDSQPAIGWYYDPATQQFRPPEAAPNYSDKEPKVA
jgi:hypothetical protein